MKLQQATLMLNPGMRDSSIQPTCLLVACLTSSLMGICLPSSHSMGKSSMSTLLGTDSFCKVEASVFQMPTELCSKSLPVILPSDPWSTVFKMEAQFRLIVIITPKCSIQHFEGNSANICRHKDSGKPRGFAFLAYEDQKSTNLAVDNLNGMKVGGRIITVDHVDNYKRKRAEVRITTLSRHHIGLFYKGLTYQLV